MSKRNAVVFGAYSEVINDDIKEQLKNLNCDPIEIMAEIANNESLKIETRLAAARELAQYVRPKLKSIDLKVEQKRSAGVAVIQFSEVDPDQAALARAALKGLSDGTGGKVPITPEALAKAQFDAARETEQVSGVMVEYLRKEAEKSADKLFGLGEILTDPEEEAEPLSVPPLDTRKYHPYPETNRGIVHERDGTNTIDAEVAEEGQGWSNSRPYRLETETISDATVVVPGERGKEG